MKKSFATACGGLLIVALAAGCDRRNRRQRPICPLFRRFIAIGVPAGYRCAGRLHAAIGRPGSGRVQARVCHVCLDP